MGWAGGTYLAEDLAVIIQKYVPKEKWLEAGKKTLDALRDEDWDCEYEVDFFDWVLHETEEAYKGEEVEWENRKNVLEKEFGG